MGCVKKCSRTIDKTAKFKTCCRSCAQNEGQHDPVCDVRDYEYKQNESNEEKDNKQLPICDKKRWRCLLYNYRNESTSTHCVMCDEPKNKKRKHEENNAN